MKKQKSDKENPKQSNETLLALRQEAIKRVKSLVITGDGVHVFTLRPREFLKLRHSRVKVFEEVMLEAEVYQYEKGGDVPDHFSVFLKSIRCTLCGTVDGVNQDMTDSSFKRMLHGEIWCPDCLSKIKKNKIGPGRRTDSNKRKYFLLMRSTFFFGNTSKGENAKKSLLSLVNKTSGDAESNASLTATWR